jgi:hypothetical protein
MDKFRALACLDGAGAGIGYRGFHRTFINGYHREQQGFRLALLQYDDYDNQNDNSHYPFRAFTDDRHFH